MIKRERYLKEIRGFYDSDLLKIIIQRILLKWMIMKETIEMMGIHQQQKYL